MADGNFVTGHAGIEALPHVAADLAVQFADAIGRARNFERQHGHAERLVRIVGFHAAQRHELLGRKLELFGELVGGVGHQLAVEAVVPGLDRRVRGENAFLLGGRQRLVELLARRPSSRGSVPA